MLEYLRPDCRPIGRTALRWSSLAVLCLLDTFPGANEMEVKGAAIKQVTKPLRKMQVLRVSEKFQPKGCHTRPEYANKLKHAFCSPSRTASILGARLKRTVVVRRPPNINMRFAFVGGKLRRRTGTPRKRTESVCDLVY